MKYMIHTCPNRKWYVDEFLYHSLLEQGIAEDDITIWNDTKRKGNLISCQESFRWCAAVFGSEERTWHLQDDVIISSRFKELAEKYDAPVINGFCCEAWETSHARLAGEVIVPLNWTSFQCICIRNDLAAEFADWVDEKRNEPGLLSEVYIKQNMHDDILFKNFLIQRYNGLTAVNLAPNIVDHIDFMIGGSTLNEQRKEINSERRSWYWYEPELVTELEKKLKERKKNVSDVRKRKGNGKSGNRRGA